MISQLKTNALYRLSQTAGHSAQQVKLLKSIKLGIIAGLSIQQAVRGLKRGEAKEFAKVRVQAWIGKVPPGLESYKVPSGIDADFFYSMLNAFKNGDGITGKGPRAIEMVVQLWVLCGANKEKLKAARTAVLKVIQSEN